MVGYIARDLNRDLYLHNTEPKKEKDGYYSEDFFQLSDELFPQFSNVTYETGPVKVEINIKKI